MLLVEHKYKNAPSPIDIYKNVSPSLYRKISFTPNTTKHPLYLLIPCIQTSCSTLDEKVLTAKIACIC